MCVMCACSYVCGCTCVYVYACGVYKSLHQVSSQITPVFICKGNVPLNPELTDLATLASQLIPCFPSMSLPRNAGNTRSCRACQTCTQVLGNLNSDLHAHAASSLSLEPSLQPQDRLLVGLPTSTVSTLQDRFKWEPDKEIKSYLPIMFKSHRPSKLSSAESETQE